MLRGSPCVGERSEGSSLASTDTSERDGGRGLLPHQREDTKSPGQWPYVVAVAEVVRRRLASNTLARRAPKRASGASEQGPDAARVPAVGIARCSSASTCRRMKGRRDPDRVVEPGRGIGEDPGWRESVIRRVRGTSREDREHAGPGRASREVASPAPGKGSLTMEGTSGRHAPRSFTSARERRPRLLSIEPTGASRANTSAARPTGEGPGRSARASGATGVSEAWSGGAPRVE